MVHRFLGVVPYARGACFNYRTFTWVFVRFKTVSVLRRVVVTGRISVPRVTVAQVNQNHYAYDLCYPTFPDGEVVDVVQHAINVGRFVREGPAVVAPYDYNRNVFFDSPGNFI